VPKKVSFEFDDAADVFAFVQKSTYFFPSLLTNVEYTVKEKKKLYRQRYSAPRDSVGGEIQHSFRGLPIFFFLFLQSPGFYLIPQKSLPDFFPFHVISISGPSRAKIMGKKRRQHHHITFFSLFWAIELPYEPLTVRIPTLDG
jgi:hypothetical protein